MRDPGTEPMTEPGLFIPRGPAAAELRFKNSRFIGHAVPCPCPADGDALLARLRREHDRADHHVFAWRTRDARTGRITHRFDDDGEPGGTAGRPVLQLLEAQRVVNGAIVVVRYFGGIKLGAGGLVRAYAATAGAALQAAGLEPLILTRRMGIEVDYAQLSAVTALLEREGLAIRERGFAGVPRLLVDVPVDRWAGLAAELREATAGRARLHEAAEA